MIEERIDKYEFVEGDTDELGGVVVHRIVALRDFGDVRAGDLGGYIEHQENLSQWFGSWVYPGGLVVGDARVSDNGKVRGGSVLQHFSRVSGNAEVTDATLRGNVIVEGDARVSGLILSGNLVISGEAEVETQRDVVFYSMVGSENGVLTAYRTKDNTIGVTRGCFTGSLGEFETAVGKTHGTGNTGFLKANKYALEYRALIDAIKIRFNAKEVNTPGLGKIYLCVDKY